MDFRLKDPDDMTPEERLARIAEILADACARLILEEKPDEPVKSEPRKNSGSDGKEASIPYRL